MLTWTSAPAAASSTSIDRRVARGTIGAVRRGRIPWKKHGGPSAAAPLEKRSLNELDALIERGAEPKARLRKAKKIRRNKYGGKRSAEARAEISSARANGIRAAATLYQASGMRRFVPQLVKQFGVSRSTVMRALQAQVCHEPNGATRPSDGGVREKFK